MYSLLKDVDFSTASHVNLPEMCNHLGSSFKPGSSSFTFSPLAPQTEESKGAWSQPAGSPLGTELKMQNPPLIMTKKTKYINLRNMFQVNRT